MSTNPSCVTTGRRVRLQLFPRVVGNISLPDGCAQRRPVSLTTCQDCQSGSSPEPVDETDVLGLPAVTSANLAENGGLRSPVAAIKHNSFNIL
jgi:hypothetical protein